MWPRTVKRLSHCGLRDELSVFVVRAVLHTLHGSCRHFCGTKLLIVVLQLQKGRGQVSE